jgi:hypothetical protein
MINHNRRKLKFLLPLLAALLVFTACTLQPTNSLVPSAPISRRPFRACPNHTSAKRFPRTKHNSPKPLGVYTTKEDVALFIHLYKQLPQKLCHQKRSACAGLVGRCAKRHCPGKCIGGDRFGNYEGLLPKKQGRIYTECDIDTLNASSRGAKRLVFFQRRTIFYTDDHYASFDLLYGRPHRENHHHRRQTLQNPRPNPLLPGKKACLPPYYGKT